MLLIFMSSLANANYWSASENNWNNAWNVNTNNGNVNNNNKNNQLTVLAFLQYDA